LHGLFVSDLIGGGNDPARFAAAFVGSSDSARFGCVQTFCRENTPLEMSKLSG